MDRILLLDRLYDAVLELTGIPRSQLDMLLSGPDSSKHVEILRSLVVRKMTAEGCHSLEPSDHGPTK